MLIDWYKSTPYASNCKKFKLGILVNYRQKKLKILNVKEWEREGEQWILFKIDPFNIPVIIHLNNSILFPKTIVI